MNQSLTNAAYLTLQAMDLAPKQAEFNTRRNTWSFQATDAEFTVILTALRSDRAREIGAQMLAAR